MTNTKSRTTRLTCPGTEGPAGRTKIRRVLPAVHDIKGNAGIATGEKLVSLKLRQLASPWAKAIEVYAISILFSLPTAFLVGVTAEAARDPVTAILPNVLYITLFLTLVALTLAATAVSNTPLKAFAATGYLHAIIALPLGIISFAVDDFYYALFGAVLILSALVALIISTISLIINSVRER